MPHHIDLLDERERIGKSFAGSVAFHALLGVSLLGAAWMKAPIQLGDKDGGGMGAVAVTAVSSIRLPDRGGETNPVAVDTKNLAPTPKAQAKPATPFKAPDLKALALQEKYIRRPSTAAEQNKWREKQEERPNQITSTVGQRMSSPQLQMTGGGGVGVGNNSPFGDQFGAYAETLRNRVAQHWQTSGMDARLPTVSVIFTLHRDGSVTGIRISSSSGNSTLDISTRRAIMDASPFPPMPPQFPKNNAEIEFVFQLKR